MVQATIETILRQKIGLDANSIGSRTIARAVEKRRLACGLPDQASYLHRLQTSPQELENLIETVVVPETWFFRDQEPFVYLSQYVTTEWLKVKSSNVLRVLSVPCSTGEEPFSIAMTLLDAGLTSTQFSIDAVDISKRALLKAKQAVYSERCFRGGGIQAKQRYFTPVGDGYEVRPFLRNTVKFMQGNILQPGFLTPAKYNVIFCRNLLIYLDHTARNQVVETLNRTLVPSGILFVGASETTQITAKDLTYIRHPFAFAYRKENRAEANVKPLIAQLATVISPDKSSLDHQPPQPTHPATSKLEIAKQLADRGQLNEAVTLCESYVSTNRTHAEAYILLGEIYQGLDRLELAEQSYQKAIYLNPHTIEALIHLALLKEQRGDSAGSEILRQRIQRLLTIKEHAPNG